MREITRKIVNAFTSRRPYILGNSKTDGHSLWLFGNKIAQYRHDGLWITNAGWESNTTKERLNAIPGVSIRQVRGKWYLNGQEWDGSWICVHHFGTLRDEIPTSSVVESDSLPNFDEFDVTSQWLNSGYSKPIYSVFETTTEADLPAIETVLNEADIPTRRMQSDTQGTYKVNHFIIVRPSDLTKALSLIIKTEQPCEHSISTPE
jgi:hypothetical protein